MKIFLSTILSLALFVLIYFLCSLIKVGYHYYTDSKYRNRMDNRKEAMKRRKEYCKRKKKATKRPLFFSTYDHHPLEHIYPTYKRQ